MKNCPLNQTVVKLNQNIVDNGTYESFEDSKIELLLYPNDKNKFEYLNDIIKYCDDCHFSYAYILHDCDYFSADDFFDIRTKRTIGTIGQPKKQHIHLIIFTVDKLLSSLYFKNKYDLKPIQIHKVDNLDSALIYLTHINKPFKHQYPIDNVVSNCFDYVAYLYENYKTGDVIYQTIEFLNKNKSIYIHKSNIMITLLEHNTASHIRAYWHMIKDLVDDHNNNIDYKRVDTKYIDIKKENLVQEKIKNLVENFGVITDEYGNKYIFDDIKRKYVIQSTN